jgi:hypothetical protein
MRSTLVKAWTVPLVAAGTLAMGGSAWAEIGTVRHVNVWAYGTPPQGDRVDLFLADDVVAEEVVETVAGGALHIRFLDGTELRLGSSSSVTLDSFVYDPATGEGDFAVDLTNGVFRVITGSLAKESYAISTPVGVIGVRGTDFIVQVIEDLRVIITVLQGSLTFTPEGGEPIGMGAGQSVSISEDGTVSAGPGAPRDPGLGNLGSDLGTGRAANDREPRRSSQGDSGSGSESP